MLKKYPYNDTIHKLQQKITGKVSENAGKLIKGDGGDKHCAERLVQPCNEAEKSV